MRFNKSCVVSYIKKTQLYRIKNRINQMASLYRLYSEKYNLGLFSTLKEVKLSNLNLDDIFYKCEVKNIGAGDFFYSLDHKIIVLHDDFIIGNIPVDYGYVITHGEEIAERCNSIARFVDRINDSRVTLAKPRDLQSALQSILFWNSLLWQTGHKLIGLGRLDKTLAQYPVPDNAEKLISDFLTTLHSEYEFKSSALKGDTGQIILLGGIEEDGTYFFNDYTSLFIRCLNKIHLPDPKILLRCSKNMPINLLKTAVECVATGIGSPLFSNDDVIIPFLKEFGYESTDALNYGVSACWEPLSIGNSLEQNNLAHIEYGKCVYDMIMDSNFVKLHSFEDVFQLYCENLFDNCNRIKFMLDNFRWQKDELLTTMMNLDNDISVGGAKYNNYGILSVGMATAVNSLLNIQKFVFEEHKYSLEDIKKIIKSNYENGTEPFSINENGYGTDNPKPIELTNRLIEYTDNCFKDYRNIYGGKVKYGLSSPVYIDFGKNVGATLDGRKKDEPFSTHISRDKGNPITEIMNFESKLKFSSVSCNANVIDAMVQSSLVNDNIEKFSSLILNGIRAGIFQLQMNVLSYKVLLDAKINPQMHTNLIVRVWGFSAYFNDLPEDYKDNLIRRAREMESIVE